MLAIRPIEEIESEFVRAEGDPEGRTVHYTFAIPADTLCAREGCGLFAHIGIFVMDEFNLRIWNGATDSQSKVEGDVTYWCAVDYVQGLLGNIKPRVESEKGMTEEEMMKTWEVKDDGT